ncbi:dihydrodipicolinate reductase C-terminal domain-containing protein [Paraflavitalea speifideaquila]|uniref:4-hydroxy-tetrahydrodipicolinate reductase n=1 Tax=Paraflavitalea speifideaquila TaxID=3076558 RepID=UPI0028EAB0AE|nr:dihydrodipicolinate reductase C-terminal domain-containing protein [Paraflavitalea speifideiaquila]
MKIALIGYGKMGKAIEEIALQRGHEIVLRVGIENLEDNTIDNIRKADAAIEFTGPESAFENVVRCVEAGVPVVCGSTGWLARYEQAANFCLTHKGALLYASNFSVGVNIFFALNKRLAELMAPHKEYDVSLTEVHHTQKKKMPPVEQPLPWPNKYWTSILEKNNGLTSKLPIPKTYPSSANG